MCENVCACAAWKLRESASRHFTRLTSIALIIHKIITINSMSNDHKMNIQICMQVECALQIQLEIVASFFIFDALHARTFSMRASYHYYIPNKLVSIAFFFYTNPNFQIQSNLTKFFIEFIIFIQFHSFHLSIECEQ